MLQTAIIRASDKSLPKGQDCFLVLGGNQQWHYLHDKNPWFLAMTDYTGCVIKQTERGFPQMGVLMFGYENGRKDSLLYGISGTYEELIQVRKMYLQRPDIPAYIVEGLKTQSNEAIAKPVNEIYFDELDEYSQYVVGPVENLSESISQRKVAQSQAAINSAKITCLEKELKQARELQKLLKKLR